MNHFFSFIINYNEQLDRKVVKKKGLEVCFIQSDVVKNKASNIKTTLFN